MPISFVKIPRPELSVGQVWECTQKHHQGWKVEVVKVADQHIEAKGLKGNQASRSKAHSANGNYNYLKTQFERDYMLISDTPTPVLNGTLDDGQSVVSPDGPTPIELPIICKRCGEMKAAEHYSHGRGGSRLPICRTCLAEAQSKGWAARRARLQQPTPVIDTSLPPPVASTAYDISPVGQSAQPLATKPGQPQQAQAQELANQLLAIAAKVDQLAPPVSLLTCIRDLLLEVTDAHGVCVVPQAMIDRLTQEFNLVKNQVSWDG